jgi:hypothetical protein
MLQSSFLTGSIRSTRYFKIFFLIAFLDQAFIRKYNCTVYVVYTLIVIMQ